MFCFLGSSPGDTVGLNLKIPLYLGGVNQTLVRVAPSVGVTTGFSGCISQVLMPGFSISLEKKSSFYFKYVRHTRVTIVTLGTVTSCG